MKTFVYAMLWLHALLVVANGSVLAQKKPSAMIPFNDKFLTDLLHTHDDFFKPIVENKSEYQVQIIYTQIDRNEKNQPSFRTFTYNVDNEVYFYPASTVKLPVALVALEFLNQQKITGLNKFSPIKYTDQSTIDTNLTIAQYIKEMLMVSDNDSYNRLFDILGNDYLNLKMEEKGYKNTRIVHKFGESERYQTGKSTQVDFYNQDNERLLQRPFPEKTQDFSPKNTISKGIGYIENGKLIEQPKNFQFNNFMSLMDMQTMLRSVVFPQTVDKKLRFQINPTDYNFLLKYLSELPKESTNPIYDSTEFYDSYVKFLMFGNDNQPIPKNIRLFNKIGMAYGYMTDNAYIVDLNNNVEFFLSTTIYCNKDGIFNDDNYEYKEIGLPFMVNLGKIVYEYELNRSKLFTPNLNEFKMKYN